MVTVFSMVPPIQLQQLFQKCDHLEFVAHGAIPFSYPCRCSQTGAAAVAEDCQSVLNADSIPRKKFFVFLVASAIEASKTVSFTSSIPLVCTAIGVRSVCGHFIPQRDRPRSLAREKAIPAPAIRSMEETKPGECRLKPRECRLKRLRDRPRSLAKEKAIPTSAIRSTEQTKPGDSIEATARRASVFG